MIDLTGYKILQADNFLHDKLIISGPCSFSSYEELYDNAKALKEMGVEYIRCGAFKPRTSPYDFQGLHADGMKIAKKIKKQLDIKIGAEVFNIQDANKYADVIDIIQVGSRNMYNYEFLAALGKLNKPVMLKRGLSATIKEWLSAAEYIAANGNNKIILCERGIRAFDNITRNVLDLQSVVLVKNICKLPVIVDPSHAGGLKELVRPMSRAAMACGADGLMIESHINPDKSMSDANQTIDMIELQEILKDIIK